MLANVQQNPRLSKATVLLIDDEEAEYHLVSELLRENESRFELEWVDGLKQGLDRLSQGGVDVVLLDLFLGESRGLDTFKRVKAQFKEIPIIIFSGLDDEQSALDAILQGAQDFLVKGHVDKNRLSRVIQYAIKRHEVQKNTRNIELIDSLTGLYNRRGFLTMAQQHLKVTERDKRGFFIYFAILNGLTKINDAHGKEEGNQALLTASEILQESFRSSDLIARLGPDEFAILTTEQSNYSPKIISARIKKNQKYYDSQFNRYHLSLSLCFTRFESAKNLSIDDLSEKATHVFHNYKAKQKMDDFFPAD